MPLGLMALKASLNATGFTSKIYQPKLRLYNSIDFNNVANHILSLKPKVIGFSTWCNTFAASLILAEQIKKCDSDMPIIFGGPQASIQAREILKNSTSVDFVLKGEADLSLPLFLKVYFNNNLTELSEVPGLSYRDGQKNIIHNNSQAYVTDLDKLPIPDYDTVLNAETIKIDVGRGCPFECTFCSTNNFFSRKYRVKSENRIIREMELIFSTHKITKFSFAHDLFTLNKKFIVNFCNELIAHNRKYNRNFKWTCSARIDCVSAETLSLMKQSGCSSIFFGIESGSSKIQKSIKKNLDFNKIDKITEHCRREKIDIYTSFMIGFPEETKSDIEDTLKLMIKLACKGAYIQLSELVILPGTQLYKKYGNKLKFDGSISNFSHSVIGEPEKLLIQKYPDLFSSFYYLPVNSISRKSIVTICRLINNLREFRNTLFLLQDEISNDIKDISLLDLCLSNEKEIKKQLSSDKPSTSFLINLFKKYLRSKFNNNIPNQIKQVFVWEATQNILKEKFLRWRIIYPALRSRNKKLNSEMLLKGNFFVTPVWNLIKTDINLELAIPEKNNWKRNLEIKKSGQYFYIVIAISDKNCKLISINSIEFELIKILLNSSINEFLDYTFEKFDIVKMKKWLNKLYRFGLIISNNNT